MLFKSTKEDKIVSSKNGFIHFKNGIYETVDKDEIEALEKALNVTKEDLEINIDELILNLDSLKSSDLKILANHFDFAYVNKDETVDKIKSILSENLEDSKSE